MVLSGGTMIHGLPRRPTTAIPGGTPTVAPAQQRPPPPTSYASSSRVPTASHSASAPPQITLTNASIPSTANAFLSQIALPQGAVVSYRQFGPDDGVKDPHGTVEMARIHLLKSSGAPSESSPLSGYLPVVKADRSSVALWVFTISTSDAGLDSLHFEEMHTVRNGSFAPRFLYPCSVECNHPTRPCGSCAQQNLPDQPTDVRALCLLPRLGLRLPYAVFLDAVRDRLIDRVSSASTQQLSFKLLSGLVMISPRYQGGSWCSEDESQHLVHCHLHISILPSRVVIQPLFKKVPVLSLPTDPTPGLPVILLPHGAPAYYIGPYLGNARSHHGAFQTALQGQGCHGWEDGGFVVCWITIKGPEERGLMAVWPRALCLASAAPGRAPLTSLPNIPVGVCPPVSPPRPTAASTTSAPAPLPPPPAAAPQIRSSPVLHHSPSTLLGALRSLKVEGKTIACAGYDSVATEMSSYVDWVLKEREREKERLAKERSDKSRRPTHETLTTAVRVHNPTPVPRPVQTAASASSTRLALPRQQGSASNPQGYYPSPPELHSPSAANLLSDVAKTGGDVSPQVTTQSIEVGPLVQDVSRSDHFLEPEPPAATEMDMTMEDVTEDDFSFFDVSGDPDPILPPPAAVVPSIIAPGTTETSGTLPAGQDSDHTATSHDPHDTSTSIEATQNTASHSILPISPARTRPSSPFNDNPKATPNAIATTPSPLQPSAELADPKTLIPPEFPYRVKELIPEDYLPVAVEAESVVTDWKYNMRGAKYYSSVWSTVSSPQPPPAPLPEPEGPDLAKMANEFMPSLTPITPAVPSTVPLPLKGLAARLLENRTSGSKPLAEVEKIRERRRAELRKVREYPAREGKFEIWHSKKFVHKFSTDTDTRFKHVKRLTGRKRNLEWNPYAYLRTEGDGDTRGTWKIWSEFRETIPSDRARVLLEEDDTDGGEGLGPVYSASSPEETVVVGEQEEEQEEDVQHLRDVRTPPPPSAVPSITVPHGATLLHTLFHPDHLFPLGTSIAQSSKDATLPANPPPPAISVPTPVSPAAYFAGGSGDSLIEAIAEVITREVVENPVWADAHRATFGWPLPSATILGLSAMPMLDAFSKVQGLSSLSNLQDAMKLEDMTAAMNEVNPVAIMATPTYVTIARRASVWDISAPAIRFWPKIGLSPLSGSKPVVAFALFDETCTRPEQVPIITQWLTSVSKIYQTLGLGTHEGGGTPNQYSDSLVPFQWETIRKTATNLIANLPNKATHIVLYVISNPNVGSSFAKEFKQLASVISNLTPGIEGLDGRVLFHFVPQSLVFGSGSLLNSQHDNLGRFVLSVYDRLLRRVSRIIPRQIFKRPTLKVHRFIPAPAYTISRLSPDYSFTLIDWPPAPVDAAERHMMLHVAYTLSSEHDWLFICAVDERGEGHQLRVSCLGPSDSDDALYNKVADRVMKFTEEFASRANAEWDVNIVRSGIMEVSELVAWDKCLGRDVSPPDQATTGPQTTPDSETTSDLQATPIHVTIGAVEQGSPFIVCHPKWGVSSAAVGVPHASANARVPIQDAAFNSTILLPYQRMQVVGHDVHSIGPDSLLVSNDPEPAYPGAPYGAAPKQSQLGLQPLGSALILRTLPSGDYSTSSPGSPGYAHSVAALQLHIFRTARSKTSSFRKPLRVHLQDVSKSYHDLIVLSQLRMVHTSFGCTPFHVAAVETMKMVLTAVKDF